MYLQFTIASVKRTKREYKYYDMFLSGSSSKEKTAIEYIVELTSDDGNRFFLFHQRKTDPALRQYKIVYTEADKMVSRDGTKYSPEHEGAYKIRRMYDKDSFKRAVESHRENLSKRQKADAAELERLAAYA